MNSRLLSTFVLALALTFSLATASEKGEKSTKSTTVKKEMKGCCSDDAKSAKGCSDKGMKNCDTKEAKATTKTSGAKAEAKIDTKSPEAKKN